MTHATKRLSAADASISPTDAVITSLAPNRIQIDSAGSQLTGLSVGDIVLLSGSTGVGNNSVYRVSEELTANDSYVFQRQGDDHDETESVAAATITLLTSQGFIRVGSIGLVLQFPAGTFSVQPAVSVDGKVFINEGTAVTTSSRVVIANHVGWLHLAVGSVTGSIEVAVDY